MPFSLSIQSIETELKKPRRRHLSADFPCLELEVLKNRPPQFRYVYKDRQSGSKTTDRRVFLCEYDGKQGSLKRVESLWSICDELRRNKQPVVLESIEGAKTLPQRRNSVRAGLTVSQAVAGYLKELAVPKHLSAKTAKPWSFIIKRFERTHGGRVLCSLDTSELTEYLDEVYEAARSNDKDGRSTFNNGRSCLVNFFAWAVSEKLVESNPALGVAKLKYEPDHRLLPVDEVSKYLVSLRQMRYSNEVDAGQRKSVSNYLWLIALTGCRLDELASATIGHFLPKERKRLIPASRAKNGKNHYPGISHMAAAVVENQLKLLAERGFPTTRSSLLFPAGAGLKRLQKCHGDGGGRMTNHVIYKHHAQIASLAGIEKFTIHDFRRIFSTLAARLGVSGDFRNLLISHSPGRRKTVDETHYQKYDFGKELQEAASRIAVALDFYSSSPNRAGTREALECNRDFLLSYQYWTGGHGIDFAADEVNGFELGPLISNAAVEIERRKNQIGLTRATKLAESEIRLMNQAANSGLGRVSDLAEMLRMKDKKAALQDHGFLSDDEE